MTTKFNSFRILPTPILLGYRSIHTALRRRLSLGLASQSFVFGFDTFESRRGGDFVPFEGLQHVLRGSG